MKHLKRKRITTILFLVLACLFVAASAIGSYFTMVFTDKISQASSQAASFIRTYDSIFDKTLEDFFGDNSDYIAGARLTASAAELDDPASLAPKEYSNGYIVRIEGDNISVPDGFPGDVKLSGLLFQSDYDSWIENHQHIAYAHIRGPFYYVEFNPIDPSRQDDAIDISAALSNLANANGCDYLYLISDELTTDTSIIIGTNDYFGYSDLSDIGLKAQQIKELNAKGYAMGRVNGSVKWLSLIHPDKYDTSADVLVIIDIKRILHDSMQQMIVIMFIAMIILITLTVWIFSVYRTVRKGNLNAEQRRQYAPANLKRKMGTALIVSSLIVFIASSFIISLNRLFIEATNEANTLTEFRSRLDDDRERTEISWKHNQNRYINTAKHLAALIDEHRELQNTAWLQQAAEVIGADYITIYDTNGDEVISSSRYRGMSLGKDEESATYDFRRLLRGVSNISHANVRDEITGLTRDMHGISLRYISDAESYGALIIAVDPSRYSATIYSDISATASSMAPVNGFIIGVHPETGIIKYSSDEELLDSRMGDLCREIESYTGSFMGFIDIRGTSYYARSVEHDGIIYYCGVTAAEMFRGVARGAFNSVWRFLILGALLAAILFIGFDQKTFDEYVSNRGDSVRQKVREKAEQAIENASDGSDDLSRERTAFLKRSYFPFMSENLSPEQRAKNVCRFLMFAATVIISIFFLIDGSDIAGSSGSNDVFNYIAHGDWTRGLNMFSVAAIFFLLCILVVILFLLRLVSGFLYLPMDMKAQASFMLITNIFRYIAVIVVIFLSLGYLGVDTRALVASAGLAGVAISLGSRDLIADIIAGINILTENTYQVGDIISVGGFRGEVAEIGMRSTKIIGRGDNIKTVRNSSVNDVINYSRLNSWYPLTITIKSSQDLDALEAMLKEKLPKIAEAYPEIISGPEFRGVDSISGDKTTILFLTECREVDINKVQRDVNREIRDLFIKHEIEIL